MLDGGDARRHRHLSEFDLGEAGAIRVKLKNQRGTGSDFCGPVRIVQLPSVGKLFCLRAPR